MCLFYGLPLKQNELRRLKNENETLKEEQRRLLSRDSYHHGVPSEEFLFTSGDDLNNNQDIQDVSDMIRSQGEINRLQAELATVRMECLHWKAVVQEVRGKGLPLEVTINGTLLSCSVLTTLKTVCLS